MAKVIKTGFLAGLAMLLVSLLMGPVTNALFPSVMTEYQNPSLFRPWSDPLMSLMFVYPIVVGFILAWVWDKTKQLFTQDTWWRRGVAFGMLYFLFSLPGMLISYSSFPLSFAMVISWSLSILAQAIGAGLLLAKLNR